MFVFFEKLLSPFSDDPVEKPPKGFFRFVWFFTRDIKWYLLMISVLAAIIGAGEAFLFYFIGLFVDILNGYTGHSVFYDYRGVFILFGLMTLVLLPACITLHALLLNQTIRVNFPMRMRYRMHRYLLRQSLSYFADEFSGRVSQKLMQTSLSLRDTVLKFSNVIVHILVYFVTMMAVLAGTDLYLMLIMLVWLAGYLSLMYYFIPRLSRLSNDNAEKRSLMVGGIVDSYANIQTVKLFSQYAKGGICPWKHAGLCRFRVPDDAHGFKIQRECSAYKLPVDSVSGSCVRVSLEPRYGTGGGRACFPRSGH